MTNDEIDFVTAAPTTVDANVRWIDGTDVDEPSYQVHRLEQHTYIIRQSLRTSPEGPFVYLLFGNSTAFLIDTGATRDPLKWPLRAVVERLIAEWLTEHPRKAYGLIVAHSHGHGDHTAGDKEFLDRPDTTVVGSDLDDVIEHFGFTKWPSQTASVNLGGRELVLIPSPGHQEASITFL
ncbi:hypothetical protein [Arthrobacter sp. 260]|uniref:hypothetical protein n=1 Tax=Arthrobacter sp. 260 TaxID=2735314 RepID=UPI0014926503|nr:hypothetical protein [Arthrobacter sp. 260]NOJ59801.1 hypothetical protein [Arthrobacter sp. 260]